MLFAKNFCVGKLYRSALFCILITGKLCFGVGFGLRPESQKLWPGGIIPYKIHASQKGNANIAKAIAHWEKNTPIRFKPWNGERVWVTFSSSGSQEESNSTVGRTGIGEKFINLAFKADIGTVIHEIGHCVGLQHEHQREDREESVRLSLQRVSGKTLPDNEDNENQIVKLNEDKNSKKYGAYDPQSVMHYVEGPLRNGVRFTFNPLDSSKEIGGSRAGSLSQGDRETVYEMYQNALSLKPLVDRSVPTQILNVKLIAEPSQLRVETIIRVNPSEKKDPYVAISVRTVPGNHGVQCKKQYEKDGEGNCFFRAALENVSDDSSEFSYKLEIPLEAFDLPDGTHHLVIRAEGGVGTNPREISDIFQEAEFELTRKTTFAELPARQQDEKVQPY